MTDGNGNTIDFRNTVIIMTSNCGSKQIRDFGRGVGFQSETDVTTGKKQNRDIVKKALDKQFAPEFMNRLDNIVYFDHLSQEDLQKIVDIELKPLLDRINEMGNSLEVSPEARELLGKKGYDVQFGARPLKRAIQDLIEDPLCEIHKVTSGLQPRISSPSSKSSSIATTKSSFAKSSAMPSMPRKSSRHLQAKATSRAKWAT